MANLNDIRLDTTAEIEGHWVDWKYGIRFLIARMNTPEFQERMRELSQPHLDVVRADDGESPEAKAKIEELTRQTISEMVLLGWENIEDDDGKPVEYTQEKALEYLTDDGLRDMYTFIVVHAFQRENYTVSASAKNSLSASNGLSNSANTKHNSDETKQK